MFMDKTVCELFAGVGGFRCGLNHLNSPAEKKEEKWRTVWFNQWEPAEKTTQYAHDCYVYNFSKSFDLEGNDTTNLNIEDVDGNLRLKGSQFWNIPYEDLEYNVKSVWQKTKDIINEGVKFEIRDNRVLNNLPKAKDNSVCHVRPHASKSAYKLRHYESGNIDLYASELPDGQWMTKQCFWLNNTYILSQLNKSFFN